MKNITAIIPARYDSIRFPGKPLAPIAGRPMIEWTYANAKKCTILSAVIVATDDSRIAAAVEGFGGDVCLTSSEHPSGTDRIAEAADKLELPADSIVVNIQGDEPLISPATVRSVIEPLLDDDSLQISTASYRIRRDEEIDNPNIVKVVTDKKGCALYFSRSPIPYSPGKRGVFYKHIGLYGYRKSFLSRFSGLEPSPLEKREKLEQLRALENGFKIMVVESDSDPVEVDVPGDIAKVLNEMSNERS